MRPRADLVPLPHFRVPPAAFKTTENTVVLNSPKPPKLRRFIADQTGTARDVQENGGRYFISFEGLKCLCSLCYSLSYIDKNKS